MKKGKGTRSFKIKLEDPSDTKLVLFLFINIIVFKMSILAHFTLFRLACLIEIIKLPA